MRGADSAEVLPSEGKFMKYGDTKLTVYSKGLTVNYSLRFCLRKALRLP